MLFAVILPTFLLVTVLENKLTQPILVEEMKQIGINAAKTLATEIVSRRLLADKTAVEGAIQEFLYAQPNVLRAEIVVPGKDGKPTLLATNVEPVEEEEEEAEEASARKDPSELILVEKVEASLESDDDGQGYWDIRYPIEVRPRDPKAPRRNLGTVRVLVSTKLVTQIGESLWKITTTAAAVSFTILFLALTFFLRKTLLNERLLRKAESQNLQLAEKLHEAERQLMNTEKLAVMGQLTASFAHEIGTPLGSIQGHLQLLREEVQEVAPDQFDTRFSERFSILGGQVSKIGDIVKSFLQSTAKPTSQRQLVDLSRIADQTIGIVRPRLEALGVDVTREYDRNMGPLRVVPVDLEQILLNLVNNSLDSIASKNGQKHHRFQIQIATGVTQEGSKQWAMVSVYDTGKGIRKSDLPNVLKPFFTTKRPGEGTGLGLTICQEIARKYGGRLDLDSREGAWTRVTLRLPYPIEV